jgi:protein FAM32A
MAILKRQYSSITGHITFDGLNQGSDPDRRPKVILGWICLGENMAPGDYASVGSGKLKLKGVKDSKVDKKKKKKSGKLDEESADKDGNNTHDDAAFQDKSVVLKSLEDEDERLAKEDVEGGKGKEVVGGTDTVPEERELVKTEAERRYEEQRRKKVCSLLFFFFLVTIWHFCLQMGFKFASY